MAPTKHGHTYARTKTKVYTVWANMLIRCRNKKYKTYHRYGGRGIKVCERWLDFRNFLADMGDVPSPASRLERKENNGNYEPGNCVWATVIEQARNRSNNLNLTYQGRTQTLAAWCEELGLKSQTVSRRLNVCGWSVERALSTPPRGWSPGRPLKRE